MKQDQFLDVVDRDQAEHRFRAAIRLDPLPSETVELSACKGRVLAEDILSSVNVPAFDRSNYDGFALRAEDTYGALEETPRKLRWLPESVTPAVVPQTEVLAGTAVAIATGAMLPRGADAVVMVEDTDMVEKTVLVHRSITPGFGISFAGTDIASGETVMRAGQCLSSRETGVLAAIGRPHVPVVRVPRVGILSTGDEIIPPGDPLLPGRVYDSNARILADSVAEIGGQPVVLGIVRDDADRLRAVLREALAENDVVVLSGGTSKGAGDLSYRLVDELTDPGIVAHGVALKPGKPVCLASHHGKAVVVLPGFPTSAIFTFHEFVAPVIRRLAGRSDAEDHRVPARLAVKVNSQVGRTEYVLVGLVSRGDACGKPAGLAAYPLGKGSGSVTTFSHADGYVTIDRHCEIVDQDTEVHVRLLDHQLKVADLIAIGSHCVGLDFLLSQLHRQNIRTKFLAVGSTGGLEAVRRGECDLAGIHLLDAASNTYNGPFLDDRMQLIRGYRRKQGVLFRPDDQRLAGADVDAVLSRASVDPQFVMVNRNLGSGTRMLLDRMLNGVRPRGYGYQVKSHHAVAAAVLQQRADWGFATRVVAEQAGLGFLEVTDEEFDFVVSRTRVDRPAVCLFRELLDDPWVIKQLERLGCHRSA